MSSQLLAKKIGVFSIFILFSLIFLGIMFTTIIGFNVKAGEEFSFGTWMIIAYVAGLSMIVLPCTMPLVFIIVPLSMGKGYKKGLTMALLFGFGLILTITAYGAGVATIGNTASLDQVSAIMFGIAGVSAFVFGLSQLKLINLSLPSYSGMPNFIQKRGEYGKSFFMGLLLGNAGVGCPNPLFYWLLIYIAGTGSVEVGSSLGLIHGVGRAIPLILMSVLALVGINATKSLTSKRFSIEKTTGFMLIVIGSFLIINAIPGGHEWYEGTIVHIGWNNLVSMTGISEFHIGAHAHDDVFVNVIPHETIPAVLVGLIGIPSMWYYVKIKRLKQANIDETA